MIYAGTSIQTPSILSIKSRLFHSSEDMTLSCTIDNQSSDQTPVILSALELWKAGNNSNLICLNWSLEEILDSLKPHLHFPIAYKVVESNKYRRISTCYESSAQQISDLNHNLSSKNTTKALIIASLSSTFITNTNTVFTILPLQPKLSYNLDELPISLGCLTITAKVNDFNALQCLYFIGRSNRSLKFVRGPNPLAQLLKAYKDKLEQLSELLFNENLSFEDLVQQNEILQKLSNIV